MSDGDLSGDLDSDTTAQEGASRKERRTQPEGKLPCPDGHLSQNLNCCEECGLGMKVPRCPICKTSWAGRFCEACGYDWIHVVGGPGPSSEARPSGSPLAAMERPRPDPIWDRDSPSPSVSEYLKLQSEPELLNELVASGMIGAMATSFGVVAKAALEQKTEQLKAKLAAETERMRIAAENERAALHEQEETKRVRLQMRARPAQPSSGEETE
ncbi:hypothetical protein ACFC1R_37620 [Kitasatospora sp. NPDC056138]|uniref:hypothetical protein n=1 Tax=Kitasatospora sp. NPDC056138 TaxID=3345724 RepID=UPI0035E10C94